MLCAYKDLVSADHEQHFLRGNNIIPYSRKIWRGIKFGGLAVYNIITTAKLKSAKISYSYILYVWRSRTEPPNLNPPIFL